MQTSSYRRPRRHSSATAPSHVTSDPVPYLSLPENFSERVMVFYELPDGLPLQVSLQVSCQTDLDAVLRPPDMIRRSANPPLFRSKAGWSVKATARSARTRRSSRSSRGWTTGAVVVQGFQKSGLCGNGRVVCRVDSVKHSTSPSRRENSRGEQSDHKWFQSQSAATEHPLVRLPRRRVSQSVVFNTFTNSAFPIVALPASVLFPLVSFTLSGSR